jgi:hypothetical protein
MDAPFAAQTAGELMSFEPIVIELRDTTLTEDEAARDAEWTETWLVSQGDRPGILVKVDLPVDGNLLFSLETYFLARNTFFQLPDSKVSSAQVLLAAWMAGSVGPGVADLRVPTEVSLGMFTDARNAGVI